MVVYEGIFSQAIKIGESVSIEVTRSPQLTRSIIHALCLLFLVFIFQHFLRKVLESSKIERKKYYKGLYVCILLSIILSLILGIEFLWLVTFIYIFFGVVNSFIRFLETWSDKILLIFLLLLVTLIFLFRFSLHYPSINLLKIISDYLNIPY